MRIIQRKILEIPGVYSNGTKIPSNKSSKIWVNLARLSTFPVIPKNAEIETEIFS